MKRLEELAAAHGLGPEARATLELLLELLEGDETAPTTVRDRARAVDAHVADSLAGLALPELAQAGVIADLGAGAGFPGIVLAVARPDATVHLVESAARKCAFLERLVDGLRLTNTRVVHARAEEWDEGLGECDAATARALAPLPVLVEYAAPLLRVGGSLVAWKGRVGTAETQDGDAAAHALGLTPGERRAVPAFPGADDHSLHLYQKVRSTPNGYPRRPGMARKRPIQASSRD